jgi:KDO2-lipid IV(A) lauroyltransferase
VKDRLGYLAYRFFTAVLGVLPEWAMRRLGEGLGRLAWYIAPRRRRLVQRHLRRVLGNDADVEQRSKLMFARYGRYWTEVFWLKPNRRSEIVEHSDILNEEALQRSKREGNGIILVLPHMGNWEVAGAVAASIGIPVLAAAENLPNPLITDWFVEIRKMVGIDIVLIGKGLRASGELAKRLGEGGTVALLSDRDLSGRGVPVVFFGEETTMPAGPVALADRTGAAIHVVGSYFKPGRGHIYKVADPLPLPDCEDRDQRIAAGVQSFAKVLEEMIKIAPEDWHLFVPNWPSDREEGE